MKHLTTPFIESDDYAIEPVKPIQAQLMMKKILHDLLILSVLLLLWFCSDAVLAGAEPDAETAYSSLWLSTADGLENQAAELLSTEIDMSVSGPILRATVKQRFRNPSQSWLEGIYSFPLPEEAAVDQLRMRVGERLIAGKIQEKQAARQVYQLAKDKGQRASLLSHHRTNIFSTSVANIGPQAEITVEFEYQQVLDFQDHQYTLRFPMVSTPQFTPERMYQVKDFVKPLNLSRSPSEAPGNPVEIHVELTPGFPIETPVSLSHPVKVSARDEDQYAVHLSGKAALSNRDFILTWKLKPTEKPMVSILREVHQGESYGLMMVMPPQAQPETQHVQARELIWVLDVSGSMQGESIEQARSAMLKALSRLRPEDYFNILYFNTQAYQLFPDPRSGHPANLNLARDKILQLEADGGTDMRPALRLALSRETHSERLRQVIFVTDGAVSNEAELFGEIQRSLGDSRLFTIGIGSAPNSYFMRKAALAGRGSFTYISQPQEVNHKIDKLLRKLEAPALTDLGFDINDPMASVLPTTLPDLYAGEPLYVAFKAEHFPSYAELTGTLNGIPASMRMPLQTSRQHKGVAVEWARRKLDELVDHHQQAEAEEKTQLREEALALALAHHQVSPFTSLVAVDQEPVRAGGELNTQHIPANAPKGSVSQTPSTGQGIRLAQTSTDNRFSLLSGLLFLALAIILRLAGNRLRRQQACAQL
jgi:Ca-activated chloride channel family protein